MSAEGRAEPFRVVFVCTGNTCRSPLAEAVARQAVEARGWTHVEVSSAGVATMDGLPPSEGAVAAAGERGLDLSAHRSTRLTGRGVQDADLILTMSGPHLARVEELGGAGRAHLITAFAREGPDSAGEGAGTTDGLEGAAGEGVPDPFGADAELYRRTLDLLEVLVEASLRRLEPTVAS